MTASEITNYGKLAHGSVVPNKSLYETDVQLAIEDLLWCDAILFVYPTW